LRETALTYFSDLSVLIKEDFSIVFDHVMTEILKTCMAEDEFKQVNGKKD
jgi:hypothetical protein